MEGFAYTNKGSDNMRDIGMVLRGNGRIGLRVLNPAYQLELLNNAGAGTGRGIANDSDGRLKTQRQTIPYGLQTAMALG